MKKKLKKIQSGGQMSKYAPIGLQLLAETYRYPSTDNTAVYSRPVVESFKNNKEKIDKAKKERDEKEIARRKEAIKKSKESTSPLKRTSYQNMAAGEKLRLFPNDPNSFFDDYINPAKWIGDMADNLGHSFSRPDASTMEKIASVAEPVLGGNLGEAGIKAISKGLGKFISKINNSRYNTPEIRKRIEDQFAKDLSLINSTEGIARREQGYLRSGEIKPTLTIGTKKPSQYETDIDNIHINPKQIKKFHKSDNLTLENTVSHEIGHAMQPETQSFPRKTGPSPADFQGSYLAHYHISDPKKTRRYIPRENKEYFLSELEPMPHLREMRQSMVDNGIIKNHYDKISMNDLERFYKEVPKNRVVSFSSPDSKLLSTLNELPSAIPVATAAGAAAYGLSEKKDGGSVSLTGYLPNSPDRFNKYNIIPSDVLTMNSVPFDLLGIADTGETKIMKSNSGEHKFKNAKYVTEMPIAQDGKESGDKLFQGPLLSSSILSAMGIINSSIQDKNDFYSKNVYRGLSDNVYTQYAQDGLELPETQTPVMSFIPDIEISSGNQEAIKSDSANYNSSSPSDYLDNVDKDVLVYLSHQQGLAGVNNILSAARGASKLRKDVKRNMENNVSSDFKKKYGEMTPGNFLDYWTNKYKSNLKLAMNKPTPFDGAFTAIGNEFGIDPLSLKTIARIESGFDPSSNRNAKTKYKGLMQLNKNEADRMGIKDLYDPYQSIYAAAKIMKGNSKNIKYEEGGEYDLSESEIEEMIKQGYEFDFS